MMKGSQFQSLSNAIMSAFPTEDALESALRMAMDIQLAHIAATGKPLPDIVFDVIRWAESRSKEDELATKLHNHNPLNVELKTYYEDYVANKTETDVETESNAVHHIAPPKGSKLKLIKALAACEVMKTQGEREALVRLLSDEASITVTWSNQPKVLATNIISTCLSTTPHKLHLLLEVIELLQDETDALKNFRRLI